MQRSKKRHKQNTKIYLKNIKKGKKKNKPKILIHDKKEQLTPHYQIKKKKGTKTNDIKAV